MFKKIIILQEFTIDNITYGLYWCHVKTTVQDEWVLVGKNNDHIQIYSHMTNTKPGDCFEDAYDEFKKSFTYHLDNAIDVVDLRQFVE